MRKMLIRKEDFPDPSSYPLHFIGDMGVKKICQGDTIKYERKGSYCYIELDTGTKVAASEKSIKKG